MGKHMHSFTSRQKICIFMILYYEKMDLFKNSICYYTMNIIENESPLPSHFSGNLSLTVLGNISL